MQVEISHEELSGLIGLIYESALEDPQWKRLLDRMGQLYPGIGALVDGHEGKSGHSRQHDHDSDAAPCIEVGNAQEAESSKSWPFPYTGPACYVQRIRALSPFLPPAFSANLA